MRITRLSIDGFGIFRDVEVPDLSPGLSIFLGDNEAGKSTTLGFVHTVFFGYPDGRTGEKAYAALNGGQAGGRLVVKTEREGLLTLERRDGKKGGPITVTGPDGRTEGPAALNRIMGGTTRNLYRNLYAFSLYELERLESLTDDAVKDFIYGAMVSVCSTDSHKIWRLSERSCGNRGRLLRGSERSCVSSSSTRPSWRGRLTSEPWSGA